jgi:hypothetical protein
VIIIISRFWVKLIWSVFWSVFIITGYFRFGTFSNEIFSYIWVNLSRVLVTIKRNAKEVVPEDFAQFRHWSLCTNTRLGRWENRARDGAPAMVYATFIFKELSPLHYCLFSWACASGRILNGIITFLCRQCYCPRKRSSFLIDLYVFWYRGLNE